jgi:hypothetical protein
LIGAIAEFGDHFVATLPSFEVHGNPRASPGTPGGANILEYPPYGGEMPIDGPAESFVIPLNGLQRSESDKGLEVRNRLTFWMFFTSPAFLKQTGETVERISRVKR